MTSTNLERFNQKTMSSREIAELTGKNHQHVLRDCDKLNEHYDKMGLSKIGQGYFTTPNTGSQQYREYLLTRMQTFDLMTGYNIELRIRVNRRWEELETKPQIENISKSDLARMILESEEEKTKLQLQLESEKELNKTNAPKVLFTDAVSSSKTSILVGELAKILKQNGIEIGQNRLFEWMRKGGFLINRKGTDYNMPTQKAMNLELFEIKETVINHSDGHISVNKTPKVTGKGQVYFIDKFLS